MLRDDKFWEWSGSSWEIDNTCNKKRFYHSLLRIERAVEKSKYLSFGSAMAQGLAMIRGSDTSIDVICDRASALMTDMGSVPDTYIRVLVGCLRFYHRFTWPMLLDDLRPKEIRCETELIAENKKYFLRLVCYPDLLIKSENGRWFYFEDKTGSYFGSDWYSKYQYHPQQFAASIAAAANDIELSHFVINGVDRGKERNGIHHSPFLSAWRHVSAGLDPVVSWAVVRPSQWAGWDYVDPLEFMTLDEWLDILLENNLYTPFNQSIPMKVNPHLAKRWYEEAMLRERRLRWRALLHKYPLFDADTHLNSVDFPHNWLSCRTNTPFECQYAPLCFGQPGVDPMTMGYVKRGDRHNRFEPLVENVWR